MTVTIRENTYTPEWTEPLEEQSFFDGAVFSELAIAYQHAFETAYELKSDLNLEIYDLGETPYPDPDDVLDAAGTGIKEIGQFLAQIYIALYNLWHGQPYDPDFYWGKPGTEDDDEPEILDTDHDLFSLMSTNELLAMLLGSSGAPVTIRYPEKWHDLITKMRALLDDMQFVFGSTGPACTLTTYRSYTYTNYTLKSTVTDFDYAELKFDSEYWLGGNTWVIDNSGNRYYLVPPPAPPDAQLFPTDYPDDISPKTYYSASGDVTFTYEKPSLSTEYIGTTEYFLSGPTWGYDTVSSCRSENNSYLMDNRFTNGSGYNLAVGSMKYSPYEYKWTWSGTIYGPHLVSAAAGVGDPTNLPELEISRDYWSLKMNNASNFNAINIYLCSGSTPVSLVKTLHTGEQYGVPSTSRNDLLAMLPDEMQSRGDVVSGARLSVGSPSSQDSIYKNGNALFATDLHDVGSTLTVIGESKVENTSIVSYRFFAVYDVQYDAEVGGSITGDTAQEVESGQDAMEVTAVPDSGFTFVKWSDDETNATRTDTNITSNKHITAMFALEE